MQAYSRKVVRYRLAPLQLVFHLSRLVCRDQPYSLPPTPPCPGVLKVRYHDIHHWYPECNYGQYIMLWDWIMGSLKPYPEGDDERQPSKGATRHSAAGALAVGKEKAG